MRIIDQETWASSGPGSILSYAINYQDLVEIILEINKDMREREDKENSGQEIRASSGPGCFLSPEFQSNAIRVNKSK